VIPMKSAGECKGKTGNAKAVVLSTKDNVATAIKSLKAGTSIAVEIESRAENVRLATDIPMGHKFALKDIEAGEAVTKYGEAIGQSTRKILRGEHVHVHNTVSRPRRGS
jgi:altronate dehydratase small subunit